MPELPSRTPEDAPEFPVPLSEAEAGLAAARSNMDQYRQNRAEHTPEEIENASQWLALEHQRLAHLAAQARREESSPGAEIINFPAPPETDEEQTG